MAIPKSKMYREVIDELVDMCHNDQGQISARRTRDGVWNQNATADYLSDQHEMNILLSRMSAADREVLAKMLAWEVSALAESLMRDVPLPEKAAADSLHIATAAVHRMKYLLTWNCAHIANVVLRPKIEAVCRAAGFEPPLICTPEELSWENLQ